MMICIAQRRSDFKASFWASRIFLGGEGLGARDEGSGQSAVIRGESEGREGDCGRTLCVGGENGKGEERIRLPTKPSLGVNNLEFGYGARGTRIVTLPRQ